jgi:hypothetical protein
MGVAQVGILKGPDVDTCTIIELCIKNETELIADPPMCQKVRFVKARQRRPGCNENGKETGARGQCGC